MLSFARPLCSRASARSWHAGGASLALQLNSCFVSQTAKRIVSRDRSVLPCALGFALGIWAGILQLRTLRAEADGFARTVTALDVRRVLASSRDGKLAIALGWTCMAALLPIVFFQHADGTAVIDVFAGYLAFMLSRDMLAYRALPVVAAAAPASTEPLSHERAG